MEIIEWPFLFWEWEMGRYENYESWKELFWERLSMAEETPQDVTGLWKLASEPKKLRELHEALIELLSLVEKCPDMQQAEKDLVGYDLTRLLGKNKLTAIQKIVTFLNTGVSANRF